MNNVKDMYVQKLASWVTVTSTLLGRKVIDCRDSACWAAEQSCLSLNPSSTTINVQNESSYLTSRVLFPPL